MDEWGFLKKVEEKRVCVGIGVGGIVCEGEGGDKIGEEYGGKKIVLCLGGVVG